MTNTLKGDHMATVTSTCDQCGKSDDHPKVHSFSGETHHHDCLSVAKKAEMAAGSPQVAAIIEQAEAGVHGDDLRTFIIENS
ncbi:MAG: hypothetical protein ACOH10_07700 [Rhodoglobus sp.]